MGLLVVVTNAEGLTENILNKKLDRHLIRGIFDGDGSIMKNGRIDFTSGSRLLLKDISIGKLNTTVASPLFGFLAI